MFLDQFYTRHNNNSIEITSQQASLFAKEVAGDFNPIHDSDAKRFCVPGDLLFSLVLAHYGLSQTMRFSFSGMVGRGVRLNFPPGDAAQFEISDDKGKTYLRVDRDGDKVSDRVLIEHFIRNYVAFSGPNFPHVLVPLMAKHNVMINTNRPLVIYESMSVEFNHLDFTTPELEAGESTLEVNGKRGDARLYFRVKSGDETVGSGFKKLIISGMQEYDQDTIERFTEKYLAIVAAYQAK